MVNSIVAFEDMKLSLGKGPNAVLHTHLEGQRCAVYSVLDCILEAEVCTDSTQLCHFSAVHNRNIS